MTNNDIEKRLWAAGQLWADSDLKPSEFFKPVLGLTSLGFQGSLNDPHMLD